MDKPFEVWVGNLGAYNEGKLVGEWIGLPQQENSLRDTLNKIAGADGELMIMDRIVREDCSYMDSMIGEWSNVYDLNVVAHQIGEEEHPAIQAYLNVDNNISLPELANLLIKEDEIAYSPYAFEGSDDEELMQRLSTDEKMGYTMLENDPEIQSSLEQLQIDGVSLMNYINVEAIGRDQTLNGYVSLFENGYFDHTADALDLAEYSMDDIKKELGIVPQKAAYKHEKTFEHKEEQKTNYSPAL